MNYPADKPRPVPAAPGNQPVPVATGEFGPPLAGRSRLAGRIANVARVAFVVALIATGPLVSWWIPGFIAGLVGVLFMHELGHYLAARASGMAVTEFFLGFGPRLWSFRRGETEYGFKAIPAGAYVRIMGMTNLEKIDPAQEHRTYRAQPYWQRMITICAGSGMHFLMAIVAIAALFGAYDYRGFFPWQVNHVVEGTSAETIGIEPGDIIVSLDGQEFDTWQDFGQAVLATPPGPVTLQVERGAETIELTGDLGGRAGEILGPGFGVTLAPAVTLDQWYVADLVPGSNADHLGLAIGDRIVAADGIVNPTPFAFGTRLLGLDGDRIELSVERAHETLVLAGPVDLDRSVEFRGFLGVERIEGLDVAPRDVSWFSAIGLAGQEFATLTRLNVKGLASVANPNRYLSESVSEPPRVGAIEYSSRPRGGDDGARPVSVIGVAQAFAASESASEVLFAFAAVNIFVGIFNLLPILPLDGGHAAVASWERLRQLFGQPDYRVDAARLVPITWLVISVLVGVGLWAMASDIAAL